jgi:hypothetical protein
MIRHYKKCPHCGRLYQPDEKSGCVKDGYPLIDYHMYFPDQSTEYEKPRKSDGTKLGESIMIIFFSMLFPPAGLLLAWIFSKSK